jgi:transposase
MDSGENVVRAITREDGIKLGTPSRKDFATRVREMVGNEPELTAMLEPLLAVLASMIEELARLTKRVLDIVKHEATCRQLMTTPGIGPINALTYRATIDRPERFERLRDVGAHLGLTPSRYQSGETDITGRISPQIGERGGDELGRTGLVEAAHTLLVRSSQWSALRTPCGAAGTPHPAAGGLAVARRRGMAKAKIAVARKLAVILHRMWIDGTDFRFGKEALA